MTPTTYRIADNAPEFPCWCKRMFKIERSGEWDFLEEHDEFLIGWYTHWCHSEERPTHDPTAPESPSDWADKLASNLCACDIICSRDMERVAKQARQHHAENPAPATPASSAAKGGDIPRTQTADDLLEWLYKNHKSLEAITADDPDGEPNRKLWVVDGCGVECMRPTPDEAIEAAIAAAMMKGVRG